MPHFISLNHNVQDPQNILGGGGYTMTSTTVSRIGDEQLDLIFCYATSCEPSDLVDVALALQTGRSIPMVCRRWRVSFVHVRS